MLTRKSHLRIRAAFILTALVLSGAYSPVQAQDWPTRAVKFVLPIGAGSGADIGARVIAEKLSARWGQPVVVENRPGGDGFVALTTFTSARAMTIRFCSVPRRHSRRIPISIPSCLTIQAISLPLPA
jgi:tripartite-type tricarboxylate transporter receptor subunit TctC